jgi:hypothetical protein
LGCRCQKIFKNYSVKMWTWSNWLKTWTSGGLLRTRQPNCRLLKRQLMSYWLRDYQVFRDPALRNKFLISLSDAKSSRNINVLPEFSECKCTSCCFPLQQTTQSQSVATVCSSCFNNQ